MSEKLNMQDVIRVRPVTKKQKKGVFNRYLRVFTIFWFDISRLTTSSYDASRVTSKLKQDRNYQPPRKSRQMSHQNSSVSQVRPELMRQKTVKSDIDNDEYKDDFEAEDVEEDEDAADQQVIAEKKEAWLYDQVNFCLF